MKRNSILLMMGLALLVAAPASRLLAADELPKGDAIVDKYVEVTGGKAAYDKIHTMVTTGTMTFAAMGLKANVTTYHAEPNKTYTEIEIPGIGKMQDGNDGKVAWSLSAMQGPHVKDGDEKDQAMREADFNGDVNWRKNYKEARTEGKEDVDGKECYKVVMTPNTGKPSTRYYDTKTNLLVKVAMTAKTPMGEIAVESMIDDYRKEGDILMPHKTTLKQGGQQFTVSIDTVKLNAEIPAGKFDPPEEIQAVLKK